MEKVKNQEELEKILRESDDNNILEVELVGFIGIIRKNKKIVCIGNSRCVCMDNSRCICMDNSSCECRDNSSCICRDNSRCVCKDNSRCVCMDNSRCKCMDNSRCECWGNSSCRCWDNSRCVCKDNSSCECRDNSSCRCWDNSRCKCMDNSRCICWGNSRCECKDNSSCECRDNSSCECRDNSSCRLFDFSCGYLLSSKGFINAISPKSVIINVEYPNNIREWATLKGIEIIDDKIQLWKVTRSDGTDWYSKKVLYDIDDEIIAPDWDEDSLDECGKGLHLADSPSGARYFYSEGQLQVSRLFLMEARIKDCKCFPGNLKYPMKIRAKRCKKIKEYPINWECA